MWPNISNGNDLLHKAKDKISSKVNDITHDMEEQLLIIGYKRTSLNVKMDT